MTIFALGLYPSDPQKYCLWKDGKLAGYGSESFTKILSILWKSKPIVIAVETPFSGRRSLPQTRGIFEVYGAIRYTASAKGHKYVEIQRFAWQREFLKVDFKTPKKEKDRLTVEEAKRITGKEVPLDIAYIVCLGAYVLKSETGREYERHN